MMKLIGDYTVATIICLVLIMIVGLGGVWLSWVALSMFFTLSIVGLRDLLSRLSERSEERRGGEDGTNDVVQ